MELRPMAIPQRVAGVIIKPSIGPKVVALVFQFSGLVAGAVLLVAWLTETPLPWPGGDIHVRWWGGILGVLAWIAIPLPMLAVLAVLKVGEYLIIADDRLQFAQRSGLVSIQIPYANIAKLELVKKNGDRFLAIDLYDIDDPDTCASGWDLAGHKQSEGWHFTMHGGFQLSIDEIYRLLETRLARLA
jgi:hypothetical protein